MKRMAMALVVVLAGAQLVRPSRTNPPTVASRTIRAQAGTPGALSDVLDRACGDCHSNQTVWPAYSRVATVSWLMVYGVNKGRRAVNFSEWARYTPEEQRILLALSCQDASAGKMPGVYSAIRPETRLSARDIDTICAAKGD
jgi:hypothetical protein